MPKPNRYNGDGTPAPPPAEPTPQSVYDTLLDAALRNVSLHLDAASVRMLAQLVQEILARVQSLEASAKLDAKLPPPPVIDA